MRLFLTVLTYLGSFIAVAAVTLFAVLFLAGPHAGLLPKPVEVVVIGLGWLVVLILPVLLARTVWRRLQPSRE